MRLLYHTDDLTDAWTKLIIVWLGTLFSRESLSYIALILTILYTSALLLALIKRECFAKPNPPIDL